MNKADKYNQAQLDKGAVTVEVVTALTKSHQAVSGLVQDGMLGPNTIASLVPPAPLHISQGNWEKWKGPLDRVPKSRAEVIKVFGVPGKGKPSRAWEKKNIVTVRDFPGVPSKWYFKCHKLAEPYFREAFTRADKASDYKIDRAGGYVFRHIRHNKKNPLSMHAFGIAVDIDPQQNWHKTYKRGAGPGPWDDRYMKIWPRGVDKEFVEAFNSVGFTWGSDWDGDGDTTDHTFYDPMHFELVDRT